MRLCRTSACALLLIEWYIQTSWCSPTICLLQRASEGESEVMHRACVKADVLVRSYSMHVGDTVQMGGPQLICSHCWCLHSCTIQPEFETRQQSQIITTTPAASQIAVLFCAFLPRSAHRKIDQHMLCRCAPHSTATCFIWTVRPA